MFQRLDVTKALVVHSMGLDELTPIGPAEVIEVTTSGTHAYTVHPNDVGIPCCDVDDLKGGCKEENAKILQDIFGGERGPRADALSLNAGYALAVCGMARDPKEGVAIAQEVLLSGKAGDVLQRWIDVSNKQSRL